MELDFYHMNILEEIRLTIPFSTFNEEMDELINIGVSLFTASVNSEEEYKIWETKREAWEDNSRNFLRQSFESNFERLQTIFSRSMSMDSFISFKNRDYADRLETRSEYLGKGINALRRIKKLVSVLDSIISPNAPPGLEDGYTTEDLLLFSLRKLYMLYDNSYYPLDIIIAGNGIQSERLDESVQIAKILIKKDHAESSEKYSDPENIRITPKGKLFIETKNKAKKVEAKRSKSDKDISKKLDEIIQKLKMQGYGQEILYEEIEELKEFLIKVPKKNWYEMVKGKLITLAVDQVINMDTAKEIFKDLTEHVLRLPK